MAGKYIGQNYIPPDHVAKVMGRARYAEDFRADGMLFTKLLVSPTTVWPIPPGMNDFPLKLEIMDKTGVDVQVLSLNVPGPERLQGPEAGTLRLRT